MHGPKCPVLRGRHTNARCPRYARDAVILHLGIDIGHKPYALCQFTRSSDARQYVAMLGALACYVLSCVSVPRESDGLSASHH